MSATIHPGAAQAPLPRPYIVTMASGPPWELQALSEAAARSSARELSGPGAQVVRASQQGDWA
jgi:hypothetical protein